MSLWAQTFFALNEEYSEAVYEGIFSLTIHGNMSFREAYSMPVGLRQWWLQRLKKHFDEQNEEIKKSQRLR
jgi:hypothetical protein